MEGFSHIVIHKIELNINSIELLINFNACVAFRGEYSPQKLLLWEIAR